MTKTDVKNRELIIKTLAIILLILATPYYLILLPKVFLGFATINYDYENDSISVLDTNVLNNSEDKVLNLSINSIYIR